MAGADIVTDEMIHQYANDGVVFIPQALSRHWLGLIELGFNRNLKTPGPFSKWHYEGNPGAFYDDYCNFWCIPEFRILLKDSPIADIMRKLMRTDRLWLYYDQIFQKEAGAGLPTPWHQDSSYWMTSGAQLGSMWITIDHITADESLEVVPGSHLGPMYNANAWDINDRLKGKYQTNEMPPIPDVDADRAHWGVQSWAITPGDVVILHPGVLHGGAPIERAGRKRRTLSVRFFGDDVTYSLRPDSSLPPFWGISELLRPGDKLRAPFFPQVRPWDAASII